MQRKLKLIDRKLVQTEDADAPCVVYIQPDETERKYLAETLRLDEHTLQSALDPDELSRLEFEPEHIAMIFKRPRNYSGRDHFLFKVSSVGAFLFKDRLVLVLNEDIPISENITFNKQFSPAYIVLKLIYRSIFHYLEHLKVMSAISDDLQSKISHSMENKHLLNLFTLQKSLVFYLNSINSNAMLIDKLRLNAAKLGFDPIDLELLDDTFIENNQCFKQAEVYSNILASLMDARASIVSNNLNVLMKTLNVITIAIMVPTFVVSAFSMNVSMPLAKHPLAFYIILGVALAAMLSFILLWRHRKW